MNSKIHHLPLPVQKWLKNSSALDHETPSQVSLQQTLRMKLSPNQQKWYTAKAEQSVNINPPAFEWAVKLRMNPFAYVYGRDLFIDGKGSTQMKLWGLVPVANVKSNPKTNEAALQRYLAEIVWYPSAALEAYIEWTAIDDFSAQATMSVGKLSSSGVFHFNEKGEVTKFTAQRFREAGPDAQLEEWTVRMLKTGDLSGIKVPLSAQVIWGTSSGAWTWLEVEVEKIQYD